MKKVPKEISMLNGAGKEELLDDDEYDLINTETLVKQDEG
jgi:hypothetical protein